MSADLHSRIASELSRRLEVAKAATAGPWSTSGPDTIAQWTIYDHQWSVASATAYDHDQPLSNRPGATGPGYIDPDANAAHIALHDPADAERRYTSALRVLERHAIIHRNIGWLEPDDGWQGGSYAELPVCGRCVPKHSHFGSRAEVPEGACIEVRDLAASLGLDTEGSTTDG